MKLTATGFRHRARPLIFVMNNFAAVKFISVAVDFIFVKAKVANSTLIFRPNLDLVCLICPHKKKQQASRCIAR